MKKQNIVLIILSSIMLAGVFYFKTSKSQWDSKCKALGGTPVSGHCIKAELIEVVD